MAPSITTLSEQAFVAQAAREDQRVDGRRLQDHRRIKAQIGVQPGNVEVQLGTTRIFAVVSASLVTPYPEKPSEGMVVIDLAPSPMADPSYEPNRWNEDLREARAVLQRALIRSRAIDAEALCVVNGQLAWSLRIDLKVLDNGGNIIDCACLAATLALKHFRHNEVSVEGDKVTVHTLEERRPVALTLHHIPLCVSFGLMELPSDENKGLGEKLVVLADPTNVEEKCMQGRLTVTASGKDSAMLYGIHKHGGAPIGPEVVLRCSEQAVQRAMELDEVVDGALKAHYDQQNFRKYVRVGDVEGLPEHLQLAARGEGVAEEEEGEQEEGREEKKGGGEEDKEEELEWEKGGGKRGPEEGKKGAAQKKAKKTP